MFRSLLIGAAVAAVCMAGCSSPEPFDPESLAEGPGGMVGNGDPITDGNFRGAYDTIPAAAAVTPPDDTRPPDCNGDCATFCGAQTFENPVHRGLCKSLWGVGLNSAPIEPLEACKRLYVDMAGHLPSTSELSGCTGDWGGTVRTLLNAPEFLLVNQRRAADTFLYSTTTVGLPRIYDMDRLVKKLYEGRVPYDLFAAVAASHPVITRRFADPGDTAEAVFGLFLGRPPFEDERADMGRLYALWEDGYVDHPVLNMRLPDAFLRFRCLDENGGVDEIRKGECASILWGYNELIFTPDIRASLSPQDQRLQMWSGLIKFDEWERLQAPGRILSRQLPFWEKAVSDVVEQYLGYDLTAQVPEVRQELVKYLLEYNGDIRSVHFAVATSIAYLQTADSQVASRYPWTYGPLKQMDAEAWIDSIARNSGKSVAACDHRISAPDAFIDSGSLTAYRVVEASRWRFDAEGQIDHTYSEMARTLGGCPENVVGGRFKVISILTTATQLSFVNEVCNVAESGDIQGAPVASLLPGDIDSSRAVDATVAGRIAEHQYGLFYGRPPTAEERDEAVAAGNECALTQCSASKFARPLCFALLSGADLLFY